MGRPKKSVTKKSVTKRQISIEGRKDDMGKARWELLPLELINEAVEVLTKGAQKYGANNWKKVRDAEDRYYAALMRHIYAYRQGEWNDPETGYSHLSHALCNIIFLNDDEVNNV